MGKHFAKYFFMHFFPYARRGLFLLLLPCICFTSLFANSYNACAAPDGVKEYRLSTEAIAERPMVTGARDMRGEAMRAAYAAARYKAMLLALQKLAAKDEIKFLFGNQENVVMNAPEPLALAYALMMPYLEQETVYDSLSGPRVQVKIGLRAEQDGELAEYIKNLRHPRNLLLLYYLSIIREQELLSSYDKVVERLHSQESAVEDANKSSMRFADFDALAKLADALQGTQIFIRYLDTISRAEEGWIYDDMLELALKLDPDNHLLLNELGYYYIYKDKAQLAREHLDASIRLHAKLADAYINRGVTMLRLELPSLSIMDFNQAIVLEPDNPYHYINRAIAWAVLDNEPEMCADLKSGCTKGECIPYFNALEDKLCAE